MGAQNKPGSEAGTESQRAGNTPGQSPGQSQQPMAPPDKSGTNIDPQENGRKKRGQGEEKKTASGDEIATNPNTDPDDMETDDQGPAKSPDADDRPSV